MKQFLMGCMLFVGLFVTDAIAANHYVVPSGGGGAGTSWTNACNGFTGACDKGSLVRGDTYYFADGTYTSPTTNSSPVGFGVATSGTQVITIKKASIADHGCTGSVGACLGWLDTMGDGQALFNGQFVFTTSYWVIDGQYRNDNDWSQTSSYGIRVNAAVTSSSEFFGVVGDNLTFRYIDVGHTDGTICTYTPTAQCPWGHGDDAFFFEGGPFANITVSHFHAHNVETLFQFLNVNGGTIEYGYMNDGWTKEAIRLGNGSTASNVTIRYNIFRNTCKGHPIDAPVACTAEIAAFGGSPAFSNISVYGNLIFKMTGYPNDDPGGTSNNNGCILLGDSAHTPTQPCNGCVAHNNTCVGLAGTNSGIGLFGTATADNNLWFANTADSSGCQSLGGGSSCGTKNLTVVSGAQFVNALTAYPATGFDYHLASATAAGTALASPYNQDMDGKTRGSDGVWDIGAFEFGTGGSLGDTTVPSQPTNFRVW